MQAIYEIDPDGPRVMVISDDFPDSTWLGVELLRQAATGERKWSLADDGPPGAEGALTRSKERGEAYRVAWDELIDRGLIEG